jgi:hypothetical protein
MRYTILLILLFCFNLSAQERYSVEKVQNAYIIDFEDKWLDYSWDANGNEIKSYGKLILDKKEYKTLIKDIKRLLNQTEADIERRGYSILKWSWDKDTVWVYKGKKGFGVAKLDIELLNGKL